MKRYVCFAAALLIAASAGAQLVGGGPVIGGGAPAVLLPSVTKCITIETPTSGDDFLFFRSEAEITITGIDCLCKDGTSVALLVKECNANGASCGDTEASITCAATNTTEASTIDDSAVNATDWMRVVLGTNTGAVTQLAMCVTYTVNN
jgi:hypothetical protein